MNLSCAEDEQAALRAKYAQSLDQAKQRGVKDKVEAFARCVELHGHLITACGVEKLYNLLTSENAVLQPYRALVAINVAFPGDDDNNRDRIEAEDATFPGCSHDIHYAVLALDDMGLSSYGCYFVFWDLEKVTHRTSLLCGNCLTMRRKQRLPLSVLLPPGMRAVWAQRGTIAVVKHHLDISAETAAEQFPSLLLRQPESSDEAEFIEAQIWGPLSKRSISRVVRAKPLPKQKGNLKVGIQALQAESIEKELDGLGIPREEWE